MAYSTHDWTARATMISVTNQRAQAEAATCNQVWVSERKEEGFKLGQKKNDWENATTLMKVRLKVHQRRCEGSDVGRQAPRQEFRTSLISLFSSWSAAYNKLSSPDYLRDHVHEAKQVPKAPIVSRITRPHRSGDEAAQCKVFGAQLADTTGARTKELGGHA